MKEKNSDLINPKTIIITIIIIILIAIFFDSSPPLPDNCHRTSYIDGNEVECD